MNKIKKIILLSILCGVLLSPLFFVQAQENPAPDLGASTPKISPPIDFPKLSVKLPGLNFDKAICTSTECSNNWLAEYIQALYQYGISVIAILAVITLMIAGVIWLTAAGNQQRIGEAKKWIGGSLMGVLIALTSYVILNMVNPALTELSPIKIAYINRIDLEPITIATDELDGTTELENTVTTTNGTNTSGTSDTHCGCPWDIQFNYSHISYLSNGKNSGNIKSHGCGAVSSWDLVRCKGKNYSLEQWILLLDKYNIAAGSSGSVGGNMPSIFQSVGLNTAYFENLVSAGKKMDELQNKNPMMVIGVRGVNKGGTKNCQFTKNGHFIFAPKKTGNSICINDPSNSMGYDNRKNADITQIQRDCLVSGVTVVW